MLFILLSGSFLLFLFAATEVMDDEGHLEDGLLFRRHVSQPATAVVSRSCAATFARYCDDINDHYCDWTARQVQILW